MKMFNKGLKEVIKILLMLSSEKSDMFSSVQNTNTRIIIEEIIEISDYYEKQKLRRAALSSIIKEFDEKVKDDPIYRRLSVIFDPIPEKRDEKVQWAKDNHNAIEEKYLKTALDLLEEKISNCEIDAELKKIVSYAVSEITSRGFSSEYIHEYVRRLMKNEATGTPIERFKKFRTRFSSIPTNFTTVFKCTISPEENVLFEPDKFPEFIGKTDREIEFFQHGYTYIPLELKARDRFSAHFYARGAIESMFNSIEMFNRDQDVRIEDDCLVYMPQSKPALITKKVKAVDFSDLKIKSFEHLIEITELLDEDSRISFQNAVFAFDTALKAKSPAIKFTFFWTVLEALIITDENEAIIGKVIQSLSPLILRDFKNISKHELEFAMKRIYMIRNLLIHKYEIHAKLESSIPFLSQCCVSVINGILDSLSEESDGPISLEKAYRKIIAQ
jgi:hypothetical protein